MPLQTGRRSNDGSEPQQVCGSNQRELAWTTIPVFIVLVLFMATSDVAARGWDRRSAPFLAAPRSEPPEIPL